VSESLLGIWYPETLRKRGTHNLRRQSISGGNLVQFLGNNWPGLGAEGEVVLTGGGGGGMDVFVGLEARKLVRMPVRLGSWVLLGNLSHVQSLDLENAYPYYEQFPEIGWAGRVDQ
jgi:hypothetical protein